VFRAKVSEYNIANSALLSLSYIYVDDAPTETIEGLNVFDVRLQITPIPSISGLTLEGEFAQELKGSVYDAQGGYAQIKYHWDSLPGSPELSYRYSALAGDNPSTPENEQFHSLAYGFSDWGTWFQGEITGEHVLDHSNLISHLYRIQVQAHENVWVNFFYYHFRLDQPEALQNDITNAHFADEFNLITDWSMNDNTQVSASFSVVIPAEGAKSYAASGNQTWIQGMLYLTFDF